jgi:regulator of protease activity HflC (stomatin/prohibitin superfamily)
MEWLSELLRSLRDWFPRKCFISPDEGGVRITLGKVVRLLEPGWYLYWPPLQECRVIKIAPQIVDLRAQSSLTRDRVNLAISGGVKYRVSDCRKALLNVLDYDKTIQTLALGIIAEYINLRDFSELGDLIKIREAILAGIKEEARGMGLYIMRIYITDIGTAKNIRILGSSNYIYDEEE